MSEPSPTPRLDAIFRRVIARRWWIVGAYALLAPAALVLALRIPKDNALERMVVASNPEVAATREFQKVFPDMPLALLLIETKQACSDPAVAALRQLHAALERVPKLAPYSVLTVWERMRPGAAARPGAGDELRRFVSGTSFFRDQGLIGDDLSPGVGPALRRGASWVSCWHSTSRAPPSATARCAPSTPPSPRSWRARRAGPESRTSAGSARPGSTPGSSTRRAPPRCASSRSSAPSWSC